MALHEANCLYVTTYPGSDVYYAAQEILPPELWPLSGWAILGQLDGLEWCRCTNCHQLKLMAPRKMKCPMMFGCKGNMERIVPRPRLTKKIKGLIEL
jgi:hypothetical protein